MTLIMMIFSLAICLIPAISMENEELSRIQSRIDDHAFGVLQRMRYNSNVIQIIEQNLAITAEAVYELPLQKQEEIQESFLMCIRKRVEADDLFKKHLKKLKGELILANVMFRGFPHINPEILGRTLEFIEISKVEKFDWESSGHQS